MGRLVEALAERRAKTFALAHRILPLYAPGGMTAEQFVASIDVPRWALADPREWLERERAPPGDAVAETTDEAVCPPGEPEAIGRLRRALVGRIGLKRYRFWVGPTTQLRAGPEGLTVVAPNVFFRDWLRRNVGTEFAAACEEVLGLSAVTFEVAADGEHALRE